MTPLATTEQLERPEHLERPSSVPAALDDRGAGADLARGARWMSLATVLVGATNYGYTVALAHLLSPAMYSRFAASQALLLTAGTLAVSGVPWVLARELSADSLAADARRRLVAFALRSSLVQGFAGGLIVYLLSRGFAGESSALVGGASTCLIFLAAAPGGWLQGMRRFQRLAVLRLVEVEVKLVAGLAVTLAARDSAAGLLGFGAGALASLAFGCWSMRGDLSLARGPRFRLGLGRSVLGVATIQGLVALFASIDVVLVAALDVPGDAGASYQASTVISRVPLFIAGAVAVVAFPLIHRASARAKATLVSSSFRLYLSAALPFAIAMALAPDRVFRLAFPASFDQIGTVAKWTALGGVALGAIELLTTTYQAERRYARCIVILAVGVLCAGAAIPSAYEGFGLDGLAVAAAGSVALTAVALLIDLARLGMNPLRLPVPDVVWFLLAALVLTLSRPWWIVWLALAALIIVSRFHAVFVRPDALEVPRRADSTRLRVLHLAFEDHARPGSGGGSLRNREVNRRLAHDFDITVIAANFPGATDRVEDGVTYRHVGSPRGYFISLLTYFARLRREIRRHDVDLVIEEFAAPFSSVLIPLWTRRPTLAMVQWLNSWEKSRQYKLPFFLFEYLGVRLHKSFIVVSPALQARIADSNKRASVAVIRNGVAAAAFEAHAARGGDVVYLGRLEVAQKGLDILIDAFARIAPEVDGDLVLVGDGPDAARVQALADKAGVGGRVRFTGQVEGDGRFDHLARAHVVAMPSRFETFGIVAIEALATGTPVVAFDIECLRDVIPATCGVLVKGFDPAEFARQLLDLYRDGDRLSELGAAGRLFARDYEWDDIAREQGDVYRSVAGAPRPARHAAVGGRASRP